MSKANLDNPPTFPYKVCCKKEDKAITGKAEQILNQTTIERHNSSNINDTNINIKPTNKISTMLICKKKHAKPLEDYIKPRSNPCLDEPTIESKQKNMTEDITPLNIQFFNGLQLLQDSFGKTIPECYKAIHERLTHKNYISYTKFLELREMISEYKTNMLLRKIERTK